MRNLFLMIKQGMKWIYNLKLQLIIIMFLTFIASTILTISFTTNQRLEKEYNTVVNTKKTPKFDSTYNITVGSKAKPEKNSTLFLPIFDFIKKDWTGMKESNNYNIVFNNIYGYDTLITKTIESNEFKTAWTSYLDMFDIKNSNKDGVTKVAENQEKFDFAIDDAFFNTMINLINSDDESIKDTVIYKYTQKNKDWYKDYLIDNGKSNWSKFINDTEFEKLRNTKNQNLKIYNYSYYAFESVSQYLFKNVRYFISQESELLDKIKQLEDNKDNKKTAILFYEFFFGKQWDQKTKIEEKYLTNDQNKYTLQFDKNPKSEFENIITLNKDKDQQPTEDDDFFKLIVSKGFRGVLRPLYIKGSSDEIEKVEWWNQTNELEGKLSDLNKYVQNVDKIDAFKTSGLVNFLAVNADEFANIGSKAVNFYSTLEKDGDNVLVPVARQYRITSAFLTHNLLAANANGYGLYIRPEIIFTDHVTKKTYRIVDITNTEFTNYEMLKGEESSSPSEITVSKQFAKANKIKIGGNISLGQQSSLLITGYSTDTYSFFPTSDPKVPLPKSKSGGIVYAKRSTITNILGKQDKADNNDNTSMFNFFLYKQKDASNLNQVYLDQFADSAKIYNNINLSSDAQTFYSKFSFKDSFYSLNWTLYERVSYYYNLTTLLSAIIIAMVTSLAVFYGVYKSIKNNAKQIGILKANGVYAQVIALSYLSYSIILTLTVIPLGWMLGTVLQVPFVGILQDYFGLKSNIIAYNSSSILITILIFGVILGAFSYLIALLNIKKPVLNIINRTDKWSKPVITNWLSEHVFKKVSFSRIITFKIAEAGKKPLMLLTGLLFVATLFISVAVALPSVAINAKDKYFKNIKYNNEYNLTDSLTNTPLGKDSINMWYGHESLSKFSKATNLNGRSIEYYENPNDYLRNISNNSALPSLIYNVESTDKDLTKAEIINPIKLYVNQYMKTGNADLPDKLLGWLSYQFTIANGRALSIGTVEQLYSYFLNDVDWDNKFNSDDDRITEVNNAATPLTTIAGQAISQMFKIKDAKIDDWRQTMLDFLLAYTPSLVKSYLTSESRKEQLSFGFQTQSIVPKKDQLATMFTPLSNNSKTSYNVLGLDKTEDSLNIRKKDKEKVFLQTRDSKEINKVFNQVKGSVDHDIYLNSGVKIYDHQTNTVIVPTIINKPLASIIDSNSDKVLENISTNNNQLTFKDKNGNFNNLPRQAWIYDDTDYVNTNYVKGSSFNKPMQNTNDHETINNYEVVGSSDKLKYYLNPYNLDTNKFTQKQVIDLWSDETKAEISRLKNDQPKDPNKPNNDQKDQELLNQIDFSHDGIVKDSPLFGDFVIKNDGSIIRSFIRPYYQMRNLLLFIPKHDGVSWQEYVAYASKWDKYDDVTTVDKDYIKDLKSTDDKIRNIKQPSVSEIPNYMVPQSVKDAWNSTLDNNAEKVDYIAIRPYDFSLNQKRDNGNDKAFEYFVFDKDGKILGVKKQVSNKLLDNLVLDGVSHFYRRALGQRHNVAPILKNENRQVTYVNKDLKIKFKKVANLELYGKAMAIVDSDIANLIYGYDTSRSTNYNYQPFDTSRVESTGKYFKKYKATTWNKVSTNNAWKHSFIGSEDAYSYSPHYYFNTLYSNVKEPLGISSAISIVADKKIGNAILDITEFSDYKASITNLQFIAEIKQLLDQLAKTAVYVAIIIILSVALAAALLIMLVVDIYVAEYKSFMIMLKSMGYTNAQIVDFTVRISVFVSLIVVILTVVMVFGIISIINTILYVKGFVLPIGYSWIAPLVSILMIFSSFFSSLWLSTRKIRKTDVSVAIHAND
ncbi:Hypothetical protein, predicted transmembrane protein, predicted permease [Mycoplasma yeatsii 13926]|uniref:ABC3 transporter permease C-terminal domain-containing protein n=1 Tax=Mycoplasma yeatsii 13926 TaxID=1188240 RepID=S6G963_9MOLU|nr:ABC transporter permease [Mycoplasma yeatsii]EOA07580.1 Hypothetical protein, predicted transmembrane protein, predicted permease [Mycoplasma yeatsii 13926]